MAEPVPAGSEFWPPAVEALVDEACDQFEAACQKAGLSGPLPSMEDYLTGVPDAQRRALLKELIPLDISARTEGPLANRSLASVRIHPA